jgi:hypothetical protein
MFTKEQLAILDERLSLGENPEDIAASLDPPLSYRQFRHALLLSGKKWEVYRRLVDTAPATSAEDRDLVTAA